MLEGAGPGIKSKASIKFIERTAKAPSGREELWKAKTTV
jgi:hypothetical protein